MSMSLNSLGILLAGGASRRFGKPKAFIKWRERYFYEYAYKALESVADDLVISTRQEYAEAFPVQTKIVLDDKRYDGQGPLAAIYSAMSAYEAEHYIILPCDMPFVTTEMLKKLYDIHLNNTKDMTLVEVGKHFQPLMSVWSRETKPLIQAQLETGAFAMKELYDKLKFGYVSSDVLTTNKHCLENINTLSQWEETLKWYKY